VLFRFVSCGAVLRCLRVLLFCLVWLCFVCVRWPGLYVLLLLVQCCCRSCCWFCLRCYRWRVLCGVVLRCVCVRLILTPPPNFAKPLSPQHAKASTDARGGGAQSAIQVCHSDLVREKKDRGEEFNPCSVAFWDEVWVLALRITQCSFLPCLTPPHATPNRIKYTNTHAWIGWVLVGSGGKLGEHQ